MQQMKGYTKTQLFYIKITAKLPIIGPVSLLKKRNLCYSEATKILKIHGDKKEEDSRL